MDVFFLIQLSFVKRKVADLGIRQGQKLSRSISGILLEGPVERADIAKTAGEGDICYFFSGIPEHGSSLFDAHRIEVGHKIQAYQFFEGFGKVAFTEIHLSGRQGQSNILSVVFIN